MPLPFSLRSFFLLLFGSAHNTDKSVEPGGAGIPPQLAGPPGVCADRSLAGYVGQGHHTTQALSCSRFFPNNNNNNNCCAPPPPPPPPTVTDGSGPADVVAAAVRSVRATTTTTTMTTVSSPSASSRTTASNGFFSPDTPQSKCSQFLSQLRLGSSAASSSFGGRPHSSSSVSPSCRELSGPPALPPLSQSHNHAHPVADPSNTQQPPTRFLPRSPCQSTDTAVLSPPDTCSFASSSTPSPWSSRVSPCSMAHSPLPTSSHHMMRTRSMGQAAQACLRASWFLTRTMPFLTPLELVSAQLVGRLVFPPL